VSNDYWAADTTRDRQPTLVFTFAGRTDLDNLIVTSGAARRLRQAGPAPDHPALLLRRDRRGADPQGRPQAGELPIHARQVTSVTLRVTGVYPVTGNPALALTEVEFYRLQ